MTHHDRAKTLMEQHFVEALPQAKFDELWGHVSECADCRARYDRLFGFEAQLDGGKGEAERIGRQVFAKMDSTSKKTATPWLRWLSGFAALATTGAGIIILTGGPQQVAGDFNERGGPETVLDSRAELQAVCFVDGANGPEAPVDLTSAPQVASCPRGGRIAVAYRNAQKGERVAIFSVRGRQATQLIPADGASTELDPGPGSHPFPGSFVIASDGEPGEVSLVAFFGKSPDAAKLKQSLETGAPIEGITGLRVQRLPYKVDAPAPNPEAK